MVMSKPEGDSGVKPGLIFTIAVRLLDIWEAHKKSDQRVTQGWNQGKFSK